MYKTLDEITYRPIYVAEQLLLLREMAVVHKTWGVRGLYFVTLCGWAGSPFLDEEPKQREATVLERISDEDWYSNDNFSRFVKEKIKLGAYHNDIIRAIDKANEKFKVPELEDHSYYGSRIDTMRMAITKLKYDSGDVGKIQKASATELSLNKNVSELRKYQSEAEANILAKRGKKLHLSLNDFLIFT